MNRDGFALLFVLVVVAALQLLAVSTLALATHETVVVDTHERTARARRAAESALRTLEKGGFDGLDSLSIGQTVMINTGGVAVRLTRLRWGLFEAVSSAPAGQAFVRRRLVLRKIDVERGLAEANDAVVTAGLIDASRASLSIAAVSCGLPAPTPRPGRALTVAASRFAPGLPDAVVDSVHAHGPAGYAFAGARWDELASIADVIAQTNIELSPVDTAGHPLVQLIYAPSDLTITGGHGAGMLLVEGNLHVMPGVRFDGVVVARGTANLSDDVVINGSLRIQGSAAASMGGATITYSPCAVAHVLLNAPAANRYIVARRRFLPAF